MVEDANGLASETLPDECVEIVETLMRLDLHVDYRQVRLSTRMCCHLPPPQPFQ